VYLITIIGGDNVSSFSRAPYVLSLREVFLHHVCKLVSSVISSSDIFRGLNCQDTVPRSVRTQCRGVSGHSAAECQDTVPRSVLVCYDGFVPARTITYFCVPPADVAFSLSRGVTHAAQCIGDAIAQSSALIWILLSSLSLGSEYGGTRTLFELKLSDQLLY